MPVCAPLHLCCPGDPWNAAASTPRSRGVAAALRSMASAGHRGQLDTQVMGACIDIPVVAPLHQLPILRLGGVVVRHVCCAVTFSAAARGDRWSMRRIVDASVQVWARAGAHPAMIWRPCAAFRKGPRCAKHSGWGFACALCRGGTFASRPCDRGQCIRSGREDRRNLRHIDKPLRVDKQATAMGRQILRGDQLFLHLSHLPACRVLAGVERIRPFPQPAHRLEAWQKLQWRLLCRRLRLTRITGHVHSLNCQCHEALPRTPSMSKGVPDTVRIASCTGSLSL